MWLEVTIIQDCQTIASSDVIKPLKLRKLQEKFPLMTSVGDMPDVSRNIVSFLLPWILVNNPLFDHKNDDIALKSGPIIGIISIILCA